MKILNVPISENYRLKIIATKPKDYVLHRWVFTSFKYGRLTFGCLIFGILFQIYQPTDTKQSEQSK